MLDFINLIIAKVLLVGISILVLFGVYDDTPLIVINQNSVKIEEVTTSSPTHPNERSRTDDSDIEDVQEIENEDPFAPPPQEPSNDVITPEPEEKPQVPQEEVVVEPTSTLIDIIPPQIINELARDAIVNIFCLSEGGGLLKPITGSGVVIDERGIILTNAHVAQYYLLQNYRIKNNIECLVRRGSPAQVAYRAELLYLSSAWINDNADNLVRPNMSATGEDDYALLRITSSARIGEELPETFPQVTPFPIAQTITRGAPLLVASYPAGFLEGVTISRNLWITTSITSIKDVFTFTETGDGFPEIDLFSVGGIIGAQEGSSGGAVVSLEDARLLGIVVTRTGGETTDERDLRALSTRHIDERIRKETGEGLKEYITGDVEKKAALFASTTAPLLLQKLIDELQ